ncbi:hypothetical protein QE152_g29385 [Popillia japonica]|uniref:Uncharacterized protein n=1 Tax=Popillia japonica TaxID=7064 RepID=A0AAW1JH62_POPJA
MIELSPVEVYNDRYEKEGMKDGISVSLRVRALCESSLMSSGPRFTVIYLRGVAEENDGEIDKNDRSCGLTNSIEEVLFNDGYDSDKNPEFVATEAEGESSDSSSVQEGSEMKENSNDSNEPSRFSSRRPKRGRKRKSMNLTRAQNKKAKN